MDSREYGCCERETGQSVAVPNPTCPLASTIRRSVISFRFRSSTFSPSCDPAMKDQQYIYGAGVARERDDAGGHGTQADADRNGNDDKDLHPRECGEQKDETVLDHTAGVRDGSTNVNEGGYRPEGDHCLRGGFGQSNAFRHWK